MNDIEKLFTTAGLKPTSNRILVMRELMNSSCPLSLGDLDINIGTMEKSSILRALTILQEHHLIHAIEDGRGIIKYERCNGHNNGKDQDMHVHFYCEKCKKVSCFENISVPNIDLPTDYVLHSINYMVKGICPECKKSISINITSLHQH